MPFLVPAVVVLALLVVLQLLFTLAILRRLRTHGDRLARLETAAAPEPVAAGELIGAFSATGLGGTPISEADLQQGVSTVGFFSPSCGPCIEQLPPFEERARTHRSLAFVIDEGDPSRQLAERLARVTTVAVVLPDSPATRAFSVSGYPMLFEIDADARVVTSGYDVGSLPQLAPTS